MADVPELSKKSNTSWAFVIALVVITAIATWISAEIYFEFQHVKRELIRVEGRMDKKTDRNTEAIEELKKPGSDNK